MGHALILDTRPKGAPVQELYVYDTLSPIKLFTPFNFATAPQRKVEVYNTGSLNGMKAYINNKGVGWGLESGNVYVYDGTSIDKICTVKHLEEDAERAHKLFKSHNFQSANMHQKALFAPSKKALPAPPKK